MRHARSLWGGILSPSGGLGLLYDAGEGPRGVALEADAGTRFDWRRFSLSIRARTLLQSSDDLERKLGLSGAVRYSPGGGGRGFFLTLSPSFGASPQDSGSPWDRVLSPSGPETPRLRLSAEAGYGFPAAPVPGLVTVVAGLRSDPHEAVAGVVRAGVRYRSRGSLSFGGDVSHTLESGVAAPPPRPRATPAASFHLRWTF